MAHSACGAARDAPPCAPATHDVGERAGQPLAYRAPPSLVPHGRLECEKRSGHLIKLPIVQEHSQRGSQAKDRHSRLGEDSFG